MFKNTINRLSIIFLIILCFMAVVTAQNTFSKFVDFEAGIADNPATLLLIKDGFVVSANFSGDTSIVSSLMRFDGKGEMRDSIVFSDFVIGSSESLIETDSGYSITGNRWSLDDKLSRSNRLIHLDSEFSVMRDTSLFYMAYMPTNTIGIQKYKDENLIYFETIDRTVRRDTKGYIYLLDSETDTVKQRIVMKGESSNPYVNYDIRRPQQTPDSNYVYIATAKAVDGPQLFDVIKINRNGDIQTKITSLNSQIINNTLVQDEAGNFYFYNRDTPFVIDSAISFSDMSGGITKVNANLDSVIWSRPINRFENQGGPIKNQYFPRGILPARDGNFIAYGDVQDNSIFKRLSFLIKFDQEGEILWTRFFKPTTIINGIIRESSFRDCKELPDGRILCLGQSDNPLKEIPFDSEIWLLMLDEEGCLEPGCEMDVIITTTTTISTSSTLPTQSGRIYPNPVTDVLHIEDVSFDSYVISDLVGRKLLQGDFNTEISLPSSLPSGMYILQLQENNRLKSVFKFLKE